MAHGSMVSWDAVALLSTWTKRVGDPKNEDRLPEPLRHGGLQVPRNVLIIRLIFSHDQYRSVVRERDVFNARNAQRGGSRYKAAELGRTDSTSRYE